MMVMVEKAFGYYSVGAVIPDMPGGQARTLIARGLVREVVDDKAMPSPVDRMMRASPARKSATR